MIETTTLGLAATDLKAIRHADTVSFHHNPRDGGKLIATKRTRNPGPFDDRERRHEIVCQTTLSGKLGNGQQASRENAYCFEMIHCANYCEDWQTVAASLKAGDELTLHWMADGEQTGYCKDAIVEGSGPGRGMSLHADALHLKIRRGDKRFSFLISVSVCVDNSARMMRSQPA